MRKPTTPEKMYLDFDGFFASVEQYLAPPIRGRPVGIIPHVGSPTIIACSREAKAAGVDNVMPVAEARRICPELVLVPQQPDMYRRAHDFLISEIGMVVPVDVVMSIDELSASLDQVQQREPEAVGRAIKTRIAAIFGDAIRCSLGYAANRQLAKMACKAGKPNGNLVWHPHDMPAPLLALKLSDVPGIGSRMETRLNRAGVYTMADLLALPAKQMRGLWGNVNGERMHYALHGYELHAQKTQRGMFGHGKVLHPAHRRLDQVRPVSRTLLVKAARRLRREGFSASRVMLFLDGKTGQWGRAGFLPAANDDHTILHGLESLWSAALLELPAGFLVVSVFVTLGELCRTDGRQLDLLAGAEDKRRRLEAVTAAIDDINSRYRQTLVSVGIWSPPPGDYTGAKIAYTRIPRAEDFY